MQSRKKNRSIYKPALQQYAPFFESLALRMGSQFDLTIDALAGWRIVMLFYPKNYLANNVEIIKNFANYREIFQKMNAQVIFCTPDTYHELRLIGNELMEENPKGYLDTIILMTDQFNTVGQQYGVKKEGDEDDFIEAMFIVNEYGKLKYSSLVPVDDP